MSNGDLVGNLIGLGIGLAVIDRIADRPRRYRNVYRRRRTIRRKRK